jgi:hypothetical protein
MAQRMSAVAATDGLERVNRVHDQFFAGVHELEHCFGNNDIDYEKNRMEKNGINEKNGMLATSMNRAQILSDLWLFDPQGTRVLIWDCICILAIVFTVFYMPVEIGFLSDVTPTFAAQAIDYLVDAIFFADIVVCISLIISLYFPRLIRTRPYCCS